MPLPRGARYIPGTGRKQVRLATGRTVTRATAENMNAQALGYPNEYTRKKYRALSRGDKNYAAQRAEALRNAGVRAGATPREQRAALRKLGFDETRARLKYDYAVNGKDGYSKSPDGPLARFLQAMGRRSQAADYVVGESP